MHCLFVFLRENYNSFYGNIRFNERRIFMSIAERRLSNKIRMFEDMLLRSKNNYEIETLRNELAKMRMSLQKMRYAKES